MNLATGMLWARDREGRSMAPEDVTFTGLSQIPDALSAGPKPARRYTAVNTGCYRGFTTSPPGETPGLHGSLCITVFRVTKEVTKQLATCVHSGISPALALPLMHHHWLPVCTPDPVGPSLPK